jgi:hypothetical protein
MLYRKYFETCNLTTTIPHTKHPNNIWYSTSISNLRLECVNIQTKILAFNFNINILSY